MTRPEILPHGVLEAEGRQQFAADPRPVPTCRLCGGTACVTTYDEKAGVLSLCWTCANRPDLVADVARRLNEITMPIEAVRTAIRGAIALREREIADDLAAALAFARDMTPPDYAMRAGRLEGGVGEIIARLRGQS